MDAEIEVRYDQRCEDFVAAAAEGVNRRAWDEEAKRLADLAKAEVLGKTLVGAGVGLLCVEPMTWLGPEYHSAVLRFVAMGIGALFAGTRAIQRALRARTRLPLRERLVRETIAGCPPTEDGPAVVRVSPEGLEHRVGPRTTRWAWPAIWRLDEFSRWDVVTTHDYRAILVPKAAYPDAQHRRRFLDELKHRQKAGGADDPVVIAWLREHDLPCTKCGYALRGLGSPVCPECATRVTLARIRQAHMSGLHARASAIPARG